MIETRFYTCDLCDVNARVWSRPRMNGPLDFEKFATRARVSKFDAQVVPTHDVRQSFPRVRSGVYADFFLSHS